MPVDRPIPPPKESLPKLPEGHKGPRPTSPPPPRKKDPAYRSIADRAKSCGMNLKPDKQAQVVIDVMTGKRMYEDVNESPDAAVSPKVGEWYRTREGANVKCEMYRRFTPPH